MATSPNNEATHEALHKLALVEALAGVGHWRFDFVTRAVEWSPQVYRIHGAPPDFDPTYGDVVAAYHPDDRDTLLGLVAHAEATGEGYEFKLRIRRQDDGDVRVVTAKAEVEHGADGVPRALVGVFRDITAQEEAERTLAAARDAAEAAANARAEFLANMSHEIRTPLNGVVALASVLAKTPLDERQREMVTLIEASGHVLERLAADALDLARVEAGKVTLDLAAFNLAETVEAAANLMRERAAEKGLGFKIDIDPSARARFVGDAVRIKQIVANLASNAVKFTDAGDVRISVAAAKGGTRIAVRDTGIGFGDDFAARLFGRFEQEGAAARGGAGIGLSLSRAIAAAMGGSIVASSTPGVGSVFEAHLPLTRAPADAMPRRAARRIGLRAQHTRVLLAEDHPTNQRVVSLIMEEAGHALTIVANGLDAVQAVANGAFDVVLMDLHMPQMDGLAATRAIRAFERESGRPATPVVVLSASATPDIVREALCAGANRHVAKPFTPQHLLEAISAELSRSMFARSA